MISYELQNYKMQQKALLNVEQNLLQSRKVMIEIQTILTKHYQTEETSLLLEYIFQQIQQIEYLCQKLQVLQKQFVWRT